MIEDELQYGSVFMYNGTVEHATVIYDFSCLSEIESFVLENQSAGARLVHISVDDLNKFIQAWDASGAFTMDDILAYRGRGYREIPDRVATLKQLLERVKVLVEEERSNDMLKLIHQLIAIAGFYEHHVGGERLIGRFDGNGDLHEIDWVEPESITVFVVGRPTHYVGVLVPHSNWRSS